jgi:serine/threonine protein kinase
VIGRAISHYRVLGTLGSGGMGVVYLAEDERLGRQVALKFLPADSITNRQALDRFRVEARAASSLSHPGICSIFDIGEDEGTPYIVMEVLRGESLRDRINRGPMRVADLLEIGIQLADALDAAHSQGIIHRDIKPSNIFVGEKNRTKILDFGLAKLTQASTSSGSSGVTRPPEASTHRDLTMPGSALGTVSYMSPEQARGEEVDTRTDLFSLGVVLYEMATGIQAFGGSTQAIVFDAILNRTPHPITHINPLIPPRLDALIATALEKERDLRHQHASDFEAELKRIRRDLESGSLVASAASRTVVLPPAERRSAMTSAVKEPPPRSRRSWIWLAAALVLVAVGVGGFKIWSDRKTQELNVAIPPATTNPSTASTASNAPTAPPPATTTPPPATPGVGPAETLSAARRAPQPQPQQPARSTAEPRPQASPPAVTPPPQRPPANGPTPGAVVVPAPSPNAAATPPPQTTEAPSPAPSPAPAPAQPQPAPPAAEPPAVQPPPRNAAATPPPAATIPPTSPVETDDAAIRGVIRTYERAFETKSIDLYRSVRPGLSAAEESRLRASFSQIDSQQVDIVVEEVRIDGRSATVRLSRRDTIMSRGQRQTATSRQTLRLDKAAAGWIISEIIGR